jgi:hypothetical protein
MKEIILNLYLTHLLSCRLFLDIYITHMTSM